MEPAETIAEVLDRVREALRSGRYSDLEGADADLEVSMQSLPALDAASLARLRRKAEENAACLLAAIRGIRAARRRVAEITEIVGGLGTYDSRGHRGGTRAATGRLSTRL